MRTLLTLLLAAIWICLAVAPTSAHHILGRPSYSLNEDSNTPPSMQVEVQLGDLFVTTMVYPAFPRLGVPSRINLYAKHTDGQLYTGEVGFSVRKITWLSWFGLGEESREIGRQLPDDNVFRQAFRLDREGDFLITVTLNVNGEPHMIDFPLRVGEAPMIGVLDIIIALVVLTIVAVTLVQRRRTMVGKVRETHGSGRS
ncbi:MAG: hypothetical protein QF726_04625 [Alphaproteobacteria bacterium]|jgi:hypothetical protein|nr:hypothetical protein [Alphaproteobacteria bacterium]HJM61971.1 hypothetical protein [Alphaproteobacteria bacterium]